MSSDCFVWSICLMGSISADAWASEGECMVQDNILSSTLSSHVGMCDTHDTWKGDIFTESTHISMGTNMYTLALYAGCIGQIK